MDLRNFGYREGFNFENRFHLETEVKYKNKKYRVSTVDLGIDHGFGEAPPLYYETMIFNETDEEENPFEYYQERYTTEKEAKKRHNEIIEKFTNNDVKDLLN